MEKSTAISRFLDESGRIVQMPRKQTLRRMLLVYLVTKFEPHTVYTERQVNDICNQWHTFGDYFLLRRELVDSGLLSRERDGSRCWRVAESQPSEQDAQ